MIEGIEQLYQRIADSMTSTIPEEWSVAEFHAIFYPDGSIYEAEYQRKSDGVVRSFQPAADGSRAIRELRRAFQTSGQQVWGRVWFLLHADGTFKVNWSYDDCDSNGDAIFDEAKELQRHEARRLRLIAGQPRAD